MNKQANARGKLIIISGFSGTGKGTMIKMLMDRHPGRFAFSVSATTRSPRPGEVEGREYFFVTKERFEEMIERGELLEHASFSGNYYGTPAAPIDEMLASGRSIILDIEVNGMQQVTARRPDTLTAFIIPPSSEELIRRLTGRGTESREQILRRLTRATQEAAFAGDYSCIIINDDLSRAVDALESYIDLESCDEALYASNLELTGRIREELISYIDKEN